MDNPSESHAEVWWTGSISFFHVERTRSAITGEWMESLCDCPLENDHTFTDWFVRFGDHAADDIEWRIIQQETDEP